MQLFHDFLAVYVVDIVVVVVLCISQTTSSIVELVHGGLGVVVVAGVVLATAPQSSVIPLVTVHRL